MSKDLSRSVRAHAGTVNTPANSAIIRIPTLAGACRHNRRRRRAAEANSPPFRGPGLSVAVPSARVEDDRPATQQTCNNLTSRGNAALGAAVGGVPPVATVQQYSRSVHAGNPCFANNFSSASQAPSTGDRGATGSWDGRFALAGDLRVHYGVAVRLTAAPWWCAVALVQCDDAR